MWLFPILLGLAVIFAVGAGVADYRRSQSPTRAGDKESGLILSDTGDHAGAARRVDRVRALGRVRRFARRASFARLSEEDVNRIERVREAESWTTKAPRQRRVR